MRKLVTVLFADVTGSTVLGEQLDPEALRGLMTRYFDTMRTIIERHGGTVEKFIGDAVMAVFGIPQVHEDDALRAVRAAADIRDALVTMNERLEAERGLSIRFRTGVHTGEVVAGDPSGGTTLVTGDTVNTAARLEQAAPPGEVLLGRLTWSLVRDAIDARPVEPIVAKGKAQPVEAWQLVAIRPGASGRARDLAAPLVGRAKEVEVLRGTWRTAVETPAPHLVTVVAGAGVGKSRLVREFVGEVGGSARVLVGRCLSYGEGITYWPIREVVHAAAGIADSDDLEAARSRIDALLASDRDGAVIAQRLAAAIGLSPEPASAEELFWAIRRTLEAIAARGPTLVVLEDLHWADDTLLDLIEYTVDLAAAVPLLLLATSRPELLERRPGFGAGRSATTLLRLEPLGDEAAGDLLVALPGGAAVPSDLRDRILAAAEGTPLYLEEFVALLRDDGHLRQDADGTWTARPGTETIPVPPGIRALLEARLEGLPEDERRVAQRASVMGRTFEVAALAGMEGVGGTDLNRPLLALVRKELLRPDRAELSAGDAFRFRHVLIRDAAYEALPKAERATLHERFADWLERAAGDRVTELEEILGYHLEQAHRYRAELGESGSHLGALAERAGRRLAAAGNRIMQLGDPGAATVLLERATAILPMDSPLLPEALMDRGSAWSRLGDAERADRGVAEARSLVRDDLPAATRYRVAIDAAHRMSAEPGGERNGELGRVGLEAVTLGESLGDERLLVRGLSALAYSHALEGHVMAEREILSRSIEIHRAAGRVAALADDIATIANRLPIGPWPVGEALLDIERMLPEVQLSPESHATVLLAQGGLEMLAGSTDRGRARLAEAKAIADEIGVIVPLAAADWPMMLGIAELLVGDAPRAREPLAWAIDVLTAAQDWGHLATVAGLAAQVLIACGDTGPDARARADLARRTSSPNDVDAEVRWRIATAILEDAAGRTSEARALASEACQIVESSEFVLLKIEALLALARVHARDPAGSVAEGARGEALALAERKGADELARRIREREL